MEFSKTKIYEELTQDLRIRLTEGKGRFKGCILEDEAKKVVMDLGAYTLRLYEVHKDGSFGDYFIEVVESYYDEGEFDRYYQVSGVGCIDGSNVRCCSYIVEEKLEGKDLFRCVACVIGDLEVARRLEHALDDILRKDYGTETSYHSRVWFK